MIRRVRITSRLADPTAAQRRIALLLGSADMRQSRLPPSAILCVRKMRDPLPQTNWLDPARSNLPREWEEAASRQLNRLAAGAALPGRGPVAPSAAAVVFLDQAELLAKDFVNHQEPLDSRRFVAFRPGLFVRSRRPNGIKRLKLPELWLCARS